MFVCIHIHVHVWTGMHAWMRVCMYHCMCHSMFVCTRVCTYIWNGNYVRIHLFMQHEWECIHDCRMFTCIEMHACICLCRFGCACMCVCMHEFTSACVCGWIGMHVCMHVQRFMGKHPSMYVIVCAYMQVCKYWRIQRKMSASIGMLKESRCLCMHAYMHANVYDCVCIKRYIL